MDILLINNNTGCIMAKRDKFEWNQITTSLSYNSLRLREKPSLAVLLNPNSRQISSFYMFVLIT
jgi:hypothetical protein